MAKIGKQERAIIVASIAARMYNDHYLGSTNGVAVAVDEAEKLLCAAEDMVAKKYGEFR